MKKNRFILNEDIDFVEPEIPVVVDEPLIEPEVPVEPTPVPEEVVTNAYSDMLQNLLRKQWDVINEADSIMATVTSDSADVNKDDLLAILKKLVDDTTVSVGLVTKALGVVDPNQEDLMNQGVKAAEEIIDAAPKEEEPIQESLYTGNVNFDELDYYERFWAEEALYEIEYCIEEYDDYHEESPEDYDEDSTGFILANLPDKDIKDIAIKAGNKVRNNDYVWDTISEALRDAINRVAREYKERAAPTTEVELGNHEGE